MTSPNSSFFLPQNTYPTPNTSGQEMQAGCNALGHALMQQALPTAAMLASMGATVVTTTSGSTTLENNLAAIPTTGAMLIIANGEAPNGKTYILESVGFVTAVVDATQTNSHTLMWSPQTPANVIANGPYSTAANTSFSTLKTNCTKYAGKAILATATTGTVTVTNNGWFQLGQAAPSGQAAAGAIWIANEVSPQGRIVIPPGAGAAFAEISLAAVAASVAWTLCWHEVQLPVLA